MFLTSFLTPLVERSIMSTLCEQHLLMTYCYKFKKKCLVMLKLHLIGGSYWIAYLLYFLCFFTHISMAEWYFLFLLQWTNLTRYLVSYKRSLHVSKSVYKRYLRRWDLGPLWTFVNLYFSDFTVKRSLKMDIGYLLI